MEQLFGGGLDDVVVEIFVELPSGDLAKCRRVCKLWRRVVDLILRDDRMLRDIGFFMLFIFDSVFSLNNLSVNLARTSSGALKNLILYLTTNFTTRKILHSGRGEDFSRRGCSETVT